MITGKSVQSTTVATATKERGVIAVKPETGTRIHGVRDDEALGFEDVCAGNRGRDALRPVQCAGTGAGQYLT